MNINSQLENPNDPGFICKPQLSISGLSLGKILLDEIITVLPGYIKQDSILKISLTQSYLDENNSYPFNKQELFNIISSEKNYPYYVEKIEELGNVTIIYLYGKIKDLEKIFGNLEQKKLNDIYLEVSGELQMSSNSTCENNLKNPEIQGITKNSAFFDSKEVKSNFLKIIVRYKKIDSFTWSYLESFDNGIIKITGLESKETYTCSYMKYCSSSDYSFYSKSILFKTF